MSGTSLDGVDAVLAEISFAGESRLIASAYLPYPQDLCTRLLNLHVPQIDEIHIAALAANELARLYADATQTLLAKTAQDKVGIRAIGCHGQNPAPSPGCRVHASDRQCSDARRVDRNHGRVRLP